MVDFLVKPGCVSLGHWSLVPHICPFCLYLWSLAQGALSTVQALLQPSAWSTKHTYRMSRAWLKETKQQLLASHGKIVLVICPDNFLCSCYLWIKNIPTLFEYAYLKLLDTVFCPHVSCILPHVSCWPRNARILREKWIS